MGSHQKKLISLLAPPIDEDGETTFFTKEEIFSIAPKQLEEMQLQGIQQRVTELLPKLPELKRLANQNRITEIHSLDELVPLLYPHTKYKSYPLALVDNCEFEQLNLWLNQHTTEDLSNLDVSNCQTLEEWLNVVESNTRVQVACSSGTSGKITLLPRTADEQANFMYALACTFNKFRDEVGFEDYLSPDIHHVIPFPRYSRHGTGLLLKALTNKYNGDKSRVCALEEQTTTNMLWLAGRMKKAIADGNLAEFKKSKAWLRLNKELEQASTVSLENKLDTFFKDVITRLRDQTVCMFMGPNYYLAMVECAERNGLEIRFAPDSVYNTAGGNKTMVSEAEEAKIWSVLPRENSSLLYGFSEACGMAGMCSEGHYHPSPWLVYYVLDPATGAPYPRKGIQTGRCAVFDLWAHSYWGGIISGDEVTINWDGGCKCGRLGHYFHGKIQRYTDKQGGDDKITCQRTAAAIEDIKPYF